MKTIQKISTSVVALFLLMPGLVKFTDKFHYFFETQIEKSNLPFPQHSFIVGQASEIITGVLLFMLLFFWNKFPSQRANLLFKIGNLMVYPIMAVALYVHQHPNVPAEVLPFEMKFPLLTLILIVLSSVNLFVQRKQQA